MMTPIKNNRVIYKGRGGAKRGVRGAGLGEAGGGRGLASFSLPSSPFSCSSSPFPFRLSSARSTHFLNGRQRYTHFERPVQNHREGLRWLGKARKNFLRIEERPAKLKQWWFRTIFSADRTYKGGVRAQQWASWDLGRTIGPFEGLPLCLSRPFSDPSEPLRRGIDGQPPFSLGGSPGPGKGHGIRHRGPAFLNHRLGGSPFAARGAYPFALWRRAIRISDLSTRW